MNKSPKFIDNIREISIILIVWLLAWLIRDWLSKQLIMLCAITSSVQNESWIVQIVLIVIVILAYVISIRHIKNNQKIVTSRLKAIIIALAFYLIFRFSSYFEFYHVPGIRIGYIDICFLVSLCIESVLLLIRMIDDNINDEENHNAKPFIYDAPAKTDKLNRHINAKHLVEKIAVTLKQDNLATSFCILLNERYGAGKTTYFNLISAEAESINLPKIDFRPWLAESPTAMMQDFLLLLDSNIRDSEPDLAAAIRSYAKLISSVKVGLLEFNLHTDIKTKSITKLRDEIAERMRQSKKSFLVLVDDVDRLDSQELLAVLKLIRNTADFPYLCYIIAADKESLSNNLRMSKIRDTDLYMRKFFNLELTFPPDDNGLMFILNTEISKTLKSFGYDAGLITDCISEIDNIESIQDVFITPRDIYRFINLLSYSLDLIREGGLHREINVLDLVYITLVQFISPECYKMLKDRNDKILKFHINNGLYSIQDDKLESLYSQSICEITKDTGQSSPNNQKSLPPSLKSLIQESKPNPINALKSILYTLFSSNSNSKTPERICYKNEYFKYFAGHYRKEEYSSAEAFELVEVPLEIFSNEVKIIKSSDKAESLLHKMMLYIFARTNFDRVDFLLKLILISEKYYSFKGDPLDQQFSYSQERTIVRKLLLSRNAPDSSFNNEPNKLVNLVQNNKRIAHWALILDAVKPQDGLIFIYGNDYYCTLREQLIDSYLQDFRNQIYNQEYIDLIPYLKRLDSVYWMNNFREFVHKTPEPMQWLYRFINVNQEGNIIWDFKYINAIAESIIKLMHFADYLNIKIPNYLLNDMASLTVDSYSPKLSETSNSFVKEAMKWRRQQLSNCSNSY